MIWATLLCGLLALAVTAWGQEALVPPGAVVTLEQAVALALQNNRLVKNAALEVEKTADHVAVARTRRFPALEVQVLESYLLTSVDFTFERGAFGTFPGIGPVPAEDTKYKSPLKGDGIPVMGWHVLRRCFGLLSNACLDFPPLIYGDLY